MTDQEDTADKNEQELNLFSAQQPEDTTGFGAMEEGLMTS